ncbi:MAG: thioredoxin family protein [Crocinitomicaceae bacterium]|nr:thioredoxin family protein [Flavobacteriales bacterium]NQZ36060.1 thioredoxin family protein [Crocinitomicaceae bacterium]
MKKVVGILFVAVMAVVVMSSFAGKGSGIDFSKVTLEKAKKEASKTGKLIFIDAYTDWCGPCKRMAATTFQDPELGKFFNKNFVNLKIEMEKDADRMEIAKRYRVRAYPTMLIIDADGNLVKSVIGFKTKDQLMAIAESAL